MNKIINSIIESLEEKKALNIVVICINKISDIADYFVICHGTSYIHMKAISDFVIESVVDRKMLHREGNEQSGWILLDYGDVIIHIFDEKTRDFYALERLWSDGEILYPNSVIGKNKV